MTVAALLRRVDWVLVAAVLVLVLAGGNSSIPHDPTESMRPMLLNVNLMK